MRAVPLGLLLLALAVPARVSAQTQENLQQAIRLYENLEVERARDMFLQVISPSSPFEVTTAQRVTAYKYLGAALATLGQRDTALTYFKGAIERDPFVDLDPQVFTQQERAVFGDAKQQLFKIGSRPIALTRIDPRSQTITFTIVTTHGANVVVELLNVEQEDVRFPLFAGQSDGLREFTWNGSLPRGGGLVPPGPYEVFIRGTSLGVEQTPDSTRILFDITHEFAALEDTLRTLAAEDLLPERYPPSKARRDLALGVGVGVVALVAGLGLGGDSLSVGRAPPAIVGSMAALAGILSYVNLSKRPEIPANVAENARRQAARVQANEAILGRNAARLAETRLLFTPVAAAQ